MLERDAAPGIHRIDHAYVNFFLVEDGDRLTVVDAGHPRSWGLFLDALNTIGRSLRDVAALVLTHGHFDHVGFARRLREEVGVPVWAPEGDRPVVARPWSYDHERSRMSYAVRYPTFDLVFAAMGAAGALWVKGVEDVRGYDSGGTLDVPGRPRVVPTPGHTYAHRSLHFPDRDAVIAGDALVTFNPYTGGDGPQIVARAATADSTQSLASLDALAATGARTVLPGHGAPWHGGVEAAAARARAIGPT